MCFYNKYYGKWKWMYLYSFSPSHTHTSFQFLPCTGGMVDKVSSKVTCENSEHYSNRRQISSGLFACFWIIYHKRDVHTQDCVQRQAMSLVLTWITLYQVICIHVFINAINSYLMSSWAFLVAQSVKNLPAVQETRMWSLGWEDPWRRKCQPIPVSLPGKSHGQRSLVGCSPWVRRVGHNWATNTYLHLMSSFYGKILYETITQ